MRLSRERESARGAEACWWSSHRMTGSPISLRMGSFLVMLGLVLNETSVCGPVAWWLRLFVENLAMHEGLSAASAHRLEEELSAAEKCQTAEGEDTVSAGLSVHWQAAGPLSPSIVRWLLAALEPAILGLV